MKSSFLQRLLNPLGIERAPGGKTKINFKTILKRLAYLAIAGFIFVAFLFFWYSRDLPTPGKIQKHNPAQATRILDRNGKVLYDVHGDEKRIVINSGEISEYLKKSVVAAEDKDFYKHKGVDFRGVLRAAFNTLLKGKGIQGGSTITQQYVKNALLSPKRSITRKIKELILSIELEGMYSKDQILTMYLNEIPYGSNVYGVEMASLTFFNKKTKDLTLSEAATLAALPQRPSYYSPYGSHVKELFSRRDYILDRMATLKFISDDDAKKAKEEQIAFAPRKENILAPHFVMYVKELLEEEYGQKTVEAGGLKVTTTLDLDKQAVAEKVLTENAKKNFARYGASNGALVALDPKNGQILAMVGSIDYFDSKNDGNVNVTIANRQPGSSIKPIAYATAFKKKYNPAFTLFDVPTDFGNYTPDNYDGKFRGPVTARYALANSLNIPAVKTLQLANIDEFLKTAHDMGITTLNERERYGLSLVLGGGEVKPLDMATAFGVFANEGTYAKTTPILKIEDSRGNILEEYKPESKKVLEPEIAYEISSILSDNEARTPIFGSRSALYFDDRPVAVKTGTTQEYRDAWTVGYTPSLAVAVWVGNNDNTPMGGHAAGAMAAAPTFHQFVVEALKDQPIEEFHRPDTIKEVTVDAFSNKLPTENSPQTITDIFAPWQEPKEYDDIHVKAKLNKLNGKIATDLTPSELIEEKIYTNLHSELPDKPNWENPVLAWAKDNGLDISSPPSGKDDFYSDGSKPNVSISWPLPEAKITKDLTITASAQAAFGVKETEFFIDNISVGRVGASPYTLTYDPKNLAAGMHQISVIAYDNYGASSKASVNVIKE